MEGTAGNKSGAFVGVIPTIVTVASPALPHVESLVKVLTDGGNRFCSDAMKSNLNQTDSRDSVQLGLLWCGFYFRMPGNNDTEKNSKNFASRKNNTTHAKRAHHNATSSSSTTTQQKRQQQLNSLTFHSTIERITKTTTNKNLTQQSNTK